MVALAVGTWSGRLHAWLHGRPWDSQGLPDAEEAAELQAQEPVLEVEEEPGGGAIWHEAEVWRAVEGNATRRGARTAS
eukprot:4197917-Lingulodinium_polyedra.AAC.1